jgi:predicted nucleic acid-binding protein
MPVMFFTLSSYELDLSAYDATYLLLAEHLSCPLATLDKDLREAAKKRGVAIVALDQQ